LATPLKVLKIIFKWLASIIAIVLTILFVLQVIIIVHFDKIIEDSLKETVFQSTDELYKLEFKNLSVNIFTGTIKAREVHLKPDTILYKRLKEIKKAPNLLFDIYIPEFQVSRIDLYNAYFNKELDLHKIYLRGPRLYLLNEPENRRVSQKDPLDLYPLISSLFKKAGAETIEILDGGFVYKRVKYDDTITHSLKNVSIKFTNILIDSTAYSDTTNFLYSDDIAASISNYSIKIADSLYILNLGRSSVFTKEKKITFENIKLIPRYPKYEFAKVRGEQTDRLIIDAKQCILSNVNIRKLLNREGLDVENIIIQNVAINAFRDKRIPRDYKKRPKMPQELLKDLPVKLKVKIVKIRGLNVNYEEMPERGGESGKVSFKNIYARITDINNDSAIVANGQTIWVKAEGHLMGKGFVQAKFKFPLNSKNGEYFYSGSLGPMSLKEMNPATKPLALIEIKDGKADLLEFDVVANNDRATGIMRFSYNNLKIQILDKEKKDGGIKERIGSFIANNFIVESDNPKNDDFRTGKIAFTRDKNKFIFNYWWKTLLSGIKPSIGLTEEKQNSINQFKKKLDDRLKKREIKRKERKEKKLARKNKDLSEN
jgi:hypothetical protein